MKKIISLFARNYETDRLVRDEVVPGAEWVLAGEGRATRKFDGMCVLYRDGVLLARFTLHDHQRQKGAFPFGWEPATEIDPVTLKQEGWRAIGPGPQDQYLREALEDFKQKMQGHPQEHDELTCEFLGPKSQGNVEQVPSHILLPHAYAETVDAPRDFAGLKQYFSEGEGRFIEGIVWHHDDGRMVKIKGKDFGVKRQGSGAFAIL